jgi:hypothetical protein
VLATGLTTKERCFNSPQSNFPLLQSIPMLSVPHPLFRGHQSHLPTGQVIGL